MHRYQGEQVSPWFVIPSSLTTAMQILRNDGGNLGGNGDNVIMKIVGVNLSITVTIEMTSY